MLFDAQIGVVVLALHGVKRRWMGQIVNVVA
jgi:hypothetical protein